MNPRKSFLALLIATAFSSPFAAAQHTPDSLRIDCQTLQRPTQHAVARALHIHNFSKVYAARDRVMQIARLECLRGASDVEIVRVPPDSRHDVPLLVAKQTPER